MTLAIGRWEAGEWRKMPFPSKTQALQDSKWSINAIKGRRRRRGCSYRSHSAPRLVLWPLQHGKWFHHATPLTIPSWQGSPGVITAVIMEN